MIVCEKCGRLGFNWGHVCPPIWTIRHEGDMYHQYGHTREQAAEAFASRHYAEQTRVRVVEVYEKGQWYRYTVTRHETNHVGYYAEEA